MSQTWRWKTVTRRLYSLFSACCSSLIPTSYFMLCLACGQEEIIVSHRSFFLSANAGIPAGRTRESCSFINTNTLAQRDSDTCTHAHMPAACIITAINWFEGLMNRHVGDVGTRKCISADLLRSPATYVVALSSVSFTSLERCHSALSQLDVNSVLHLRKLLFAISAAVYLCGSGLQ